jgi:adenosylhomocysteine nucleosidase
VTRVAFLTAMDLELRPLVRPLALQRSGSRWSGRLGQVDVVATVIGVGPPAARRVTESVLASGDIDRVIVVGVAGGVDPALSIGDVVVPALVVDRATGAAHPPAPLGDRVGSGTLLTCEEAIFDMTIISVLPADGVVAVDMETAAVAEVCEARGVPWSVFRGISDRPADGLVDARVAALARPDGSPDLPAVARYVAARPWVVPKLARLGRDLKKATTAAAGAAVRALEGL